MSSSSMLLLIVYYCTQMNNLRCEHATVLIEDTNEQPDVSFIQLSQEIEETIVYYCT